MKVTRLSIQNILGIDTLEIAPGQITTISGGNGVGKTSVLEAIKAALGGGNDASLIRNGSDSAKVVLVLEDGTEIARSWTEDGKSTVAVKNPAFGKVSSPATYLKRLTDALSVNPVSFITAPADKRAAWLLEVLPVEVSDADLKACGLAALPPASANGLDRIAAAHKAVYDERTGVNRVARDKKGTIAQLEKSLPLLASEDWATAAVRAEQEKDAALRAEGEEMTALEQKAAAVIKSTEDEFTARIRAIETERSQKLAELKSLLEQRRSEIRTKHHARLEQLAGILAESRERAKQSERDVNSREVVSQARADVEKLDAESGSLSAVLENLDALKAKALDKLPIKNTEIREGQIFVGGIPFDRLNKARQVQFALNVARLRAGELPLCLVDGLECLDAETFQAFEEMAPASGLQLILNRVTTGPLSVKTAGA